MSERSGVESVTVHSSWRGIILGSLGAGIVGAAGTIAVSQVGFGPVPTVLFGVGWVLVLAMVLDYPIASTFTSGGVTRRMMLRRQHFRWADDHLLTRTRPTLIRVDRRLEHGALALVKGRRRYLLVDRLESAAEFDGLVDIVEADGDASGASMLPRPGDKVPPTWLYRRSHWRPEPGT